MDLEKKKCDPEEFIIGLIIIGIFNMLKGMERSNSGKRIMIVN